MLNTNGELPTGLSGLVDQVTPSVGYLFGKSSRGSCWAISKNVLVTNSHVVDDQEDQPMKVRIGGKLIDAKVIGSDPRTDIAVIRVKDTLRPLALAEGYRVGEFCLAVGSPHGFVNSVSFGVVSGINRSVSSDEGVLENLLQTDAAINPGNSGGPIFNMGGQVIGMSTLSRAEAEAMHYAISAEMISFIVPRLIASKSVIYGRLGVLLAEKTDEGGATQVSVVRPLGSHSLLRVRDEVLAIDAREVRGRVDVLYAMVEGAKQSSFQVSVRREGVIRKLKVLNVHESD